MNYGGTMVASERVELSTAGIFIPALYLLSYEAILAIVVGLEPTTNGLKVRYSTN